MKSNYKRLGSYISEVTNINTMLGEGQLRGISSIYKHFMQSKANIVDVDFMDYKIVKKWQFAFNPNTARMGDKIPIALNLSDDCIVSKIYPVFEILNEQELNPEYLMMWFRRPEFDRYARFKSHGSAREIFDWEEMCNVQLPVPTPDKQKEIVKEYNIIINRIALNNQLIHKLEETAQAIYKQWFIDFDFPDEEGKPYKSSGGEIVESEFGGLPRGWEMKKLKSICSKIGSGATPDGGKENYQSSGIALIRSMNVHDFVFDLEDMAFIDENQARELKNVTIESKDILLNITGVSVARCCIVPEFILPARVNQHVMIIRPHKELFMSYYLLCSLCYSDNKSKLLGISQSGSTREAITKTEVEEFEVTQPDLNTAKSFNQIMMATFNTIEIKIKENKLLNDLRELLLSRLARMEN